MQWIDKPTIRGDAKIGAAIFVGTFGVYILTLCPTIYWEDSAAFCAVHSLLGIPHSPGFPIYVLLGRLFSTIPVGSQAFRSNLASAFWSSLGLVLLYFLIIEIFKQVKWRRGFLRLSAVTAILFFAFSTSFWLQAIRAEVYSLNILFTLLLIFLALKWRHSKSSDFAFKRAFLFSFVLGISLTNHPLLIIMLVPAFIVFFASVDLRFFSNSKRLFLLTIFFILGTSVYLYLPLRSSLSPAINWGKPDSWSNLLAYLLRTSGTDVLSSALSFPYLNRLWFNLSFSVEQFGLAFFWMGVVGAISLFKTSRRIFLFTLVIFLLNILTATWATDFSLRNYDLLGYLLPSLSLFAIWFTFGLSAILDRTFKGVEAWGSYVDKRKKIYYRLKLILCVVILLLPLFQIRKNFSRCNKRSQTWAYTYANQILNSAEKDALILVGDDNTLTSLWYLNLSQNIRPDVKIISVSGLTQRSYREQISSQYQDLKLSQLRQKDLGKITYQICQLNANRFPILTTSFFNHVVLAQHLRPAGYLFEFSPQNVILTDKDIEKQRVFLKKNIGHKNFDSITREHFGNFVFNLGAFYDRMGHSFSIKYFLWALEVDPSNPRIYFQLGKAFLKNGDKAKALNFFQAGLELDPYNLEAKKLLEET